MKMNINYKNEIINKINKKKLVIGVIGLGYVGLPLAILLAKKGYKVFGFDTDKEKISSIYSRQSYIKRIDNNNIRLLLKKGKFFSNYKNIFICDVVIICVPTPLYKNKPDLSYIRRTVKSINQYLRFGQTIILESTSYPGTTEEEIAGKINKKFKIGKNFFIGFSSERINPGENENKLHLIPKVISGFSINCRTVISHLYGKLFKKIVKAKTLKIAEFSKLLENIYRAVNIGFINEMKFVADKMKTDIYEVISVASTKPYGFVRFNPGPGVGGHCIPIDPNYLYWKAKEVGVFANFIELSAETNIKVVKFIKNKILKKLKDLKIDKVKAKILILGLAYKKNVDDLRESSSLKLITLLKKNKINKIEYSDPYVTKKINTRDFKLNLRNIKLTSKKLSKYDIVVIMTDHDKFNYKDIYKYSKNIIDCRGRYKIDHKVTRG